MQYLIYKDFLIYKDELEIYFSYSQHTLSFNKLLKFNLQCLKFLHTNEKENRGITEFILK